jgi:hydroxymethylpyrimidine/phosphomethylpyrimidine kinase
MHRDVTYRARMTPPRPEARTPRALTIAGSDSGGGAGIQADLKAFARCGVHGCAAITAITAQNTLGVEAVHLVPEHIVLEQVRAVVSDIGVDAVKVGMLATREMVHAVALALDELVPGTPVVVDPVMVAESGAQLLDPDAQLALVREIVPRATVLTPNVPEAQALIRHAPTGRDGSSRALPGQDSLSGTVESGSASPAARQAGAEPDVGEIHPDTPGGAEALAQAVLALGAGAVVLTGGHRAQATDLLVQACAAERVVSIPGQRHPDGATHGSGCTHSSVLAAQLALGRPLLQAAIAARALAGAAVANGLRDVGQGPGPVDVIGLADIRRREVPASSVPSQ